MGLIAGLKRFVGSAPPGPAVLETDSLRIELPEGWRVRQTQPVSAVGPDGEILKISSFSISGDGPAAELEHIRAEVTEKLKNNIARAAEEPVFKNFSGVAETSTVHGPFYSASLLSIDGKQVFMQYGVLGPRTFIYANCQFPIAAESRDAVLTALKAVEWR